MTQRRWMSIVLMLMILLCCQLSAAAEDQADLFYQPGDPMEDFTLTLSDGAEVSLQSMLLTKKAVVINFWTADSEPCQQELPHLQNAYDQFADDIAVLALSADAADTDEIINHLKDSLGLATLPMGRDGGLSARFQTESLPATVVVDRNGVVCFVYSGAVPSADGFASLFRAYTGEDYSEPVLLTALPEAQPSEAADNTALSGMFNVPQSSPKADAAGAADVEYLISYVDPDGKPVEGVMTQICTDQLCMVFPSDAMGEVHYTGAAYSYELHVLMVPAGYAPVSEVYTLPAEGGTLTVTLKTLTAAK